MPVFSVLYDDPQEANWFKSLHSRLGGVEEFPITGSEKRFPNVKSVLAYDRPDIILLRDGNPVLVIEETVEVPSGHNVGQRFARLAAAAEAKVPVIYFGPFVAKKHGGETSGPRYMNLRLFYALESMALVTASAITVINWPVDDRFEVIKGGHDINVRRFMDLFFSISEGKDLATINKSISKSSFFLEMSSAKKAFAKQYVKSPEQYDLPPDSVRILNRDAYCKEFKVPDSKLPDGKIFLVYNVGMTYMRSDPYTGMAILYRYLYIASKRADRLILYFPSISKKMWQEASKSAARKDVKLFKIAADAIQFCDIFLLKESL
jgi:hypothetical protein